MNSRVLTAIAACLLGACAEPDRPAPGQTSWECPTALPPAPAAVAFDSEGALVWLRGDSGAILARDPRPAAGSLELAFDPFGGRLLTVEPSDAGFHTIVSYAAGARLELATVQGRAALLPLPAGVVVFEPARWWLLEEEQALDAPLPASAAALDGERFAALVPEGRGLTLRGYDASDALAPESIAESVPRGAQLVAATSVEGVVLARSVDGQLHLELLDPGGRSLDAAALAVPATVGDVVEMRSLGAASRSERVAILLARPGRLVVADLGPEPRESVLPLGGSPSEVGLLANGLVALSAGRLLVARNPGVAAVTVGDKLELAFDPRFDGRALSPPLAGPLGVRQLP
jgi:hypothetical protein